MQLQPRFRRHCKGDPSFSRPVRAGAAGGGRHEGVDGCLVVVVVVVVVAHVCRGRSSALSDAGATQKACAGLDLPMMRQGCRTCGPTYSGMGWDGMGCYLAAFPRSLTAQGSMEGGRGVADSMYTTSASNANRGQATTWGFPRHPRTRRALSRFAPRMAWSMDGWGGAVIPAQAPLGTWR